MSILKKLFIRYLNVTEKSIICCNMFQYTRQLFPLILGNSRVISESLHGKSHLYYRSLHTGTEKRTKSITLEDNPFYQKYADKIKLLKRSDPAEYNKRMEALQKIYLDDSNYQIKNKEKSSNKNIKSTPGKTYNPQNKFKKTLSSIIKINKFLDKTSNEIEMLWKEYYKSKDAVCAVIKSESYKILHDLASSYPTFVYPLPRKDGYEMFIGQYSDDVFYFTSLIHYHKYQENSPIQLSLHHFTDFLNDKGIVLMSGEMVDEGVNVTDAQLLAYEIQHFYNDKNFQLVKDFNINSKNFNFNSVIESLDNVFLNKEKQL